MSLYAPKVRSIPITDPMHVIRFQVVGRGVFPYDMLRYDRCFPAHPESAAALHSLTPMAPRRTITLIRHGKNPRWLPTVDRWSSFGWTVVTEAGYEGGNDDA